MRLLKLLLAGLLVAVPAAATDIGLGAVDGLTKPNTSAAATSITSGVTTIIGGNNQSICFDNAGVIDCGNTHCTFNPATNTLTCDHFSGTFNGTVTGNVNGNATTATALAANPTDCSAGQFANAIDAMGNLTCAVPTGTGPAPPDKSIQFNDASAFGGTADFTWDYTHNRFAAGNLTAATDASSVMAKFSGTLPTTPTSNISAFQVFVAGNGNQSFKQYASEIDLQAGYTGSQATGAIRGNNNSSGTGANLQLESSSGTAELGNFGGVFDATATTAGYNVGAYAAAHGSSVLNVASFNRTSISETATHIGTLTQASNSNQGTALINVGLLATTSTASTLPAINASFSGLFDGSALGLWNQQPLEFFGSSTNFVAFKAPASIGSSVTWTLPSTDSTGSQALVSNGSGILGWSSISKTPVPVNGCNDNGLTSFGPVFVTKGDCPTVNEAQVKVPSSVAGTFSNLYCFTEALTAGSKTITIRKNGVDQSVTCTITDPATTCNDTTHTFTYAIGDLLDDRINVAGGAAATNVNCTARADP